MSVIESGFRSSDNFPIPFINILHSRKFTLAIPANVLMKVVKFVVVNKRDLPVIITDAVNYFPGLDYSIMLSQTAIGTSSTVSGFLPAN